MSTERSSGSSRSATRGRWPPRRTRRQNPWGQPVAAFRQAPSYDASNKAVAAWLRWGQKQAEQQSVADFDRSTFVSVVGTLRGLSTQEPFSETLRDLRKEVAEARVIFLVLSEFAGTRLSGATHWAGSTPVVQLSLRYRRDDQFWFTLLHECRHVMQGRQRTFVDFEQEVDQTDTEEEDHGSDEGSGRGELNSQDAEHADEQDADEFARETLVPSASLEALTAPITSTSVREFAAGLGVAPGIVVGRLQRDGQLRPDSSLNALNPNPPIGSVRACDWGGRRRETVGGVAWRAAARWRGP